MSKKKSQDELKMMGSVAGVLLSIIETLVSLVRELGGTFADFHRLTTPEGADDLKAIAAIIARAKKTAGKSFAELLAACKQYYIDKRFCEKNFPLELVAKDETEWEVCEHHFDRAINGLKAFEELEKLGYALCGPRRAMEYIANGHTDHQLDHSLIVTACWRHSRGGWYAPVFRRDYGGRYLNLCRLSRNFGPRFGWLVLRRKRLEEEYFDLLPGVED